ncbi:hypothetical protein M0R72_07370 [Candidatus Pacearchaeota archaeon]|jgi:hypothetical protein|nr:hypothetical protein [Candidatus Pacearchaeota archaeon]
MANEATIRSSLQIRKGEIDYQSRPTSHHEDVTGTNGPCPGAVTATVAGVNVDFSPLVTPGLVTIHNLDSTNFVEYGAWDPVTSTFFPIGEVPAGAAYSFRLSRNLGESYGTGTSTTGTGHALRVKADTASVNVVIEAFEA